MKKINRTALFLFVFGVTHLVFAGGDAEVEEGSPYYVDAARLNASFGDLAVTVSQFKKRMAEDCDPKLEFIFSSPGAKFQRVEKRNERSCERDRAMAKRMFEKALRRR